jgi:hypothetical protein
MAAASRSRNSRSPRRAARPRLEDLEPRLALSASPRVAIVGDTLTVQGTPRPDRIQIEATPQSGTVRVVFDGKVLGSYGPVASIDVNAGAGNDIVTVDPRITLPTLLDGGPGNDRLRGGSGPNTLVGGAGKNVLIGMPGRDTFDSSSGQDRLVAQNSLGVIQVGPSVSGAALKDLSGAYTLRPLLSSGPAVVDAAELRDGHIAGLLKSDYDGGQAVAIANATANEANALASLLGYPTRVTLPAGVHQADLVAFREVTVGGQTTFSTSVLLPVAQVPTTPAQRAAGLRADNRGAGAYLNGIFTPTPSYAAPPPDGGPQDDLINLASRFFSSYFYSDKDGNQAQLDDTVYSVRSFGEQQDYYYVSQELQLTSAFSTIGQVESQGNVTSLNSTTPGLHGSAELIQPSPLSTGVITQYTTGVNESFSGSIGWNQTSGLNASIGGGVNLSNSSTTVVPPVSINYHPILSYGIPEWLFSSNNSNLNQMTINDSWIWIVPFGDYSPGQTYLPILAHADVGPVTGPTTYDFDYTFNAPLPFGDTFQLQKPVVSGVNVPTVAPGGEFTITGSAFYPFLVDGVVIGGQALGPASFSVLNDGQIEVVAPDMTGNALPVIVKTSQGFSNANVTINIASASQLQVQAQPVAAVAGQAFTNQTVATFTDSDPNANAADFTANIGWGDGNTSAGTITAAGQGTFDVVGAHTYANAGTYNVDVQVNASGGGQARASGTATVSGAAAGGPQHLVAQPIAAAAGQAFTNLVVGTFADSDPGANPSDFTASIDWGDGYSAVTTVTAAGQGTFDVLGTHTYTAADTYTFDVQVTDSVGKKATATGTATISGGN